MAGLSSLPTKVVEVAFTGTDTTPTWTNITQYVTELDTKSGRNKEVDQFDAGTISLTLKNADRRFDPEYAAGPYFGNLLPMKPIRVRATWNSITYDVFRGYVDQWPQTYLQPRMSWSHVTATDGFKPLSRSVLGEPFDNQVVSDSTPTHWWPLGDAVESGGLADIVTVGLMPAGPVSGVTLGVEGIVPGSSGTAMRMTAVDQGVTSVGPSSTSFSVGFWVQVDTPTTASTQLFKFGTGATNSTTFAYLDNGAGDGFLRVNVGNATSIDSLARIDDGLPHHVVITTTATSAKAYLDGVLLGTQSRTSSAMDQPGRIGQSSPGAFDQPVTLQHFILYDGVVLTPTQVTDRYSAGVRFAGETASAIVSRVLDWVDWPAGLRDIDTSSVVLQGVGGSVGGSSALDVLRTLNATEHGQLYMSPTGMVTFRSRSAPYTDTRSITSQATYGDAVNQLPYSDLAFSFDDQILRNFATGKRAGGVEQVWQDPASITTYYRQGWSRPQTLELYDPDVLGVLQFEVANHKDAITRVDKMVMNGRSTNGTQTANQVYAQLLGRIIGDRITVNRTPQALGAVISKVLHIEGIQHHITPEDWVTTFSLAPVFGEYGGATGYLIYDDATRGKWDENRWGI